MKILTFIILFLINTLAFSQKVTEIGMNETEIRNINHNICLSDTLDDGTPFIKGMLSDNINYIYYFFNDKKECFCIILFFKYFEDIQYFVDLLNKEYIRTNNFFWKSYDSKYFIWLEEIEYEIPMFYIWDNKLNKNEYWYFLKNLEKKY